MGNVIGVDFSYASPSMLDAVQVAVLCSSDEEANRVKKAVEDRRLGNTLTVPFSAIEDSTCFQLFSVPSSDIEAAIQGLSGYRSVIKNITTCGNKCKTLITTLESLLPGTVICELDHGSCMLQGEQMTKSLREIVVPIGGAPDGSTSSASPDDASMDSYLQVTVHSGVRYHLVTDRSKEPVYVGDGPIGCSAIAAMFNMFTKRHGISTAASECFPAIMALAKTGTSDSCDLKVSDIYGGACEDIGLPGETMAASFGKLHRLLKPNGTSIQQKDPKEEQHSSTYEAGPRNLTPTGLGTEMTDNTAGNQESSSLASIAKQIPSKQDFAYSLMQMLIINVSHHATLHAQIHGINKVVFCGIICDDDLVRVLLNTMVGFWSRGAITSYVYRNSRYMGAIGATSLAI